MGQHCFFKSANLTNWTYLHPLAISQSNPVNSSGLATMWECPQLIALGVKYILTFGVWNKQPCQTSVQIGTYSDQRFTVEREQRLDFGDDYFYAPQTLVEANGRAVMWGWIKEGRGEVSQLTTGWAGVMSLPRVLSILPDGSLGIEPASELRDLRGRQQHFGQFQLAANTQYKLAGVQGTCFELIVELQLEAQSQFKIALNNSIDQPEQTVIMYNRVQERLEVNTYQPETNTKKQWGGIVKLGPNEPLRLHIFVDRSVIEVFANGRACLTARVYPHPFE